MKHARATAILTDVHLWVPVAALVLGIALLIALH